MRAPQIVQADATPVGQTGRNETRLIITASTLWRGEQARAQQLPHENGVFASGLILLSAALILRILAVFAGIAPVLACPGARVLAPQLQTSN